MDFRNPRGKPFTAADAAAVLRSLSRIPIEPKNFKGKERQLAEGLQAIQKRVEEAIVQYEARHQGPLTYAKREMLRESLIAKLLNRVSPESTVSPFSQYVQRHQKSFAELLKMSEKRRQSSKKKKK